MTLEPLNVTRARHRHVGLGGCAAPGLGDDVPTAGRSMEFSPQCSWPRFIREHEVDFRQKSEWVLTKNRVNPKMEPWYLRSPGGLILTHIHTEFFGHEQVELLFAGPWLSQQGKPKLGWGWTTSRLTGLKIAMCFVEGILLSLVYTKESRPFGSALFWHIPICLSPAWMPRFFFLIHRPPL